MNGEQVILGSEADFHALANEANFHALAKHSVWKNGLVIPAYASILSLFILVLQAFFSLHAVQDAISRLLRKAQPESEDVPTDQRPTSGFFAETKAHINSHGGPIVYVFKITRLLACLGLVGLTMAAIVLSEQHTDAHGVDPTGYKKGWGKKHKHRRWRKQNRLTETDWAEVALFATFVSRITVVCISIGHLFHQIHVGKREVVGPEMYRACCLTNGTAAFPPQSHHCTYQTYASILAIVTVTARRKWSAITSFHLEVVTFVAMAVYTVRDVWPLCTFTLTPVDPSSWLLWTRIGLLGFVSILVPLFTPRQHVPVDPRHPTEPAPEQTTPLIMLLTWTFLDGLVMRGFRQKQLSNDELPPLADYDRAEHLVNRGFSHLDPFKMKKRKHLFWGFMAVFWREYVGLAAMLTIKAGSNLLAPIGIHQLLQYIESGGEGAIVRPWVWISYLFLAPVIDSFAMQWYIFLATRTLVRVEGIIIQLVFEHSLRIRMKEEARGDSSASSQSASATLSASDSGTSTPAHEVEAAASDDDATVQPSADSTVSSSKAKGKAPSVASSAGSSTAASTSKDKDKSKEKSEDEDSKDNNLVGKINNLVATDTNNIIESRDFLFVILLWPLSTALSISFLYVLLGWSAFVGLAVMIALFPIPGYVAKQMNKVQIARMKHTDARVQAVTESMNVLRMIKLFGWEKKTAKHIADTREDELKYIWKRALLQLMNGNINWLIPLLQMIVVYLTYTMVMKRSLTAAKVFASIAVFETLRDGLHTIFFFAPRLIQGKVSLDRVNNFLRETELLDEFSPSDGEHAIIAPDAHARKDVIGFHDAMFCWSASELASSAPATPSKRNFRLHIQGDLFFERGKFNLIVGPTGCGKTSTLMALLGEMHFIPTGPGSWFSLPRAAGVAYAAQESWVLNETIRENILFGQPYEEERYEKVLFQCALKRDMELFEAGDLTEVGEKGLTLSGGQKARVTLARAVYSNAEILLLDDVLAALDVHTSKWLVDNLFQGDLVQGRTVVLVTHNIALAGPLADFVVSLGSDGRILTRGSVKDALSKNSKLRKELKVEDEAITKAEAIIDDSLQKAEEKPAPDAANTAGKLILAEDMAVGHVTWKSLTLYFWSLGGAYFWTVYLGFMLLCHFNNVFSTWWLGQWAGAYESMPASEVPTGYYLTIYTILILISVVFYCISFGTYLWHTLKASRSIHARLVESVLGTTLRWLDTTPTARVIARCTQDMRAGNADMISATAFADIVQVDNSIPLEFDDLVELSLMLFTRLAGVVYLSPVFILPGVFVFIIGGICGQMYIQSQLSVKRIMSNARSPVLANFGAAIAGLTSIRAYGAQQLFRSESLKRINLYTRSARSFYNLNRWISFRIDIIGGLFAAGLGAYLVYGQDVRAAGIGFSLNMAVAFSSLILWWVRTINEFEVAGNSLERIQEYLTIEQEPKPTESGVPPAYWPASGGLRVENLCARYSSDGPKVLHDLTFTISSGERVGVVGRTGSGKSSLTLSLLRAIYTSGEVYYDSRPTSQINIDVLRSNITIIPQMPELLSGSLRRNLDPFNLYDDATLNNALRSAGLFALQAENDEDKITLDTAIASGGGNLSVGQRQILALARAIVRQSKLLILDEATSAVDYNTDTIIQNSIRNELRDVTLITVAHRLQTIMDSDKIMVLDGGRMVEFDSPKNLLKIKDGYLRRLVDESGEKDALYAMAEKAAKS